MKREGEIFLTDQVQQVRAAVIGDMMADRYVPHFSGSAGAGQSGADGAGRSRRGG